MPQRRPRTIILLLMAAIFFIFWPALVGLYTDWLWFQEVGYQVIFTTAVGTKLILGLVVGLIAMLVTWVNLRVGLRLSAASSALKSFIGFGDREVALPDFAHYAQRLPLPVSLGVGLLAGALGWGEWEMVLRYLYQTPFGEAEPIFNRDIAFYFFTLPLLELVARLLLVLLVVNLVALVLLYAARTAVVVGEGGIAIERGARSHLLAVVAVGFLLFAWRAYLEMPGLLYSDRGPVAGASYTDVNARLPMLKVEAVVAVLVAVLAAASIFRAKTTLLWLGLGGYLLVLVVGGWLYPLIVQRFSVAPNELEKEAPYIAYNIAATRKAFKLEQVEERELRSETTLGAQDIENNRQTINNIRLWDHQPLLDTFAQIQEIRTYYEFESVDNDRYRINGELRQTMLSVRELAVTSLPTRNWINERLTFTHGFGLTLGPVNQVTQEGLPVLFIKDLPPVSTIPTLKITQPEIYYGELAHDPIYVKTGASEFNYPAGEENVYTDYQGEGGVGVGSLWRRIVFATRFADKDLLLSAYIKPESRVLYYRNIRDRLRKAAPFLRFDQDPYLVISEGRLYWICDAYTVSDRYPYSQPVGDWINYIRNSVKAVIDAYHGHVRLYVADEGDPLIQTYRRIFPEILRPLQEMPADLRAHLRYPEYIFSVQTAVYSTYHMDQPQIFYNKEDQWEVASVGVVEGKPQVMEPYYTIMRLPGEKKEEFILMLPFTPRGKDNLAAWMVARADGENYGRLLVYRFPKQKLVFGPKQIVARINQDPEISRQISLWNQHGSQVILGTLLVIPINESLIYVQPLYLRAAQGKIPELKRVIVAAENRIAMEETLERSLARILGSAPATTFITEDEALTKTAPPAEVAPTALNQNLTLQAKQAYDRALQAQREGDWARYGEEIKRLGALLEQLARQK